MKSIQLFELDSPAFFKVNITIMAKASVYVENVAVGNTQVNEPGDDDRGEFQN